MKFVDNFDKKEFMKTKGKKGRRKELIHFLDKETLDIGFVFNSKKDKAEKWQIDFLLKQLEGVHDLKRFEFVDGFTRIEGFFSESSLKAVEELMDVGEFHFEKEIFELEEDEHNSYKVWTDKGLRVECIWNEVNMR